LLKVYETIKIGDPFDPSVLCGPLHSKNSIQIYEDGLEKIKKEGGKVLCGGKRYEGLPDGNYVCPTIVEMDNPNSEIMKSELFCPIMYVMKCKDFEDGVRINNSVPQGLSSGLFTSNMKNVFKWMGPTGSDCGLANVNLSTSGAEIGGAFGGEKETGGGRESGGEAWRQYMRQTTSTVNYGSSVSLAQGVKFEI
jgi:aldehyde dehydrogenase family 7 protein A1